MEASSAREAAADWVAARNAAGLLYGIIISAAVMSAAAGHVPGVGRLVASTLFVLVVYWFADIYVRAFTQHFTGERTPLGHRILTAARHESSVLLGGVPAILMVLLETLAGVELDLAVDIALWFTAALLAVLGYLAARRAGAGPRTSLGEATVAGLLGIFMVVAKGLLH